MKISVRKLVLCAMLAAINVVLSHFPAIDTQIVKINFGFVPIVVAAICFGPLYSGLVYAVADFLDATLLPTSGAFFPGFTVTALLTGIVFGLILYKKPASVPRAIAAALATGLLFTVGLNTFWLSVFYKLSPAALISKRLLQCCVTVPLQSVCIYLIRRFLIPRLPVKDFS